MTKVSGDKLLSYFTFVMNESNECPHDQGSLIFGDLTNGNQKRIQSDCDQEKHGCEECWQKAIMMGLRHRNK